MTLELRFAPEAESDLLELFAFIAADNPRRARSYIEDIRRSCRALCDTPLMGRARSDLRPGVRVLPLWRRLVVIYEVDGMFVDVLRVFSSGRDYELILADR